MTNQKTPEQGDATEATRLALEAFPHRDVFLEGAAYMTEERSRVPLREAFVLGYLARSSSAASAPQGGATEEQIEAAAAALREDVLLCHMDGSSVPWNDLAHAALSASASAHPAGERHDAEEREAESENHAATVTGDREKLRVIIDDLRAYAGNGTGDVHAPAELFRQAADALAAPVEVGSRRVEYLFIGHPGWPDPIISEDEVWARRWFEEHRSKHPVRVDRRVVYRSGYLRGEGR